MISSLDDWAIGLALAASERGDCTRSQVGAVALDMGGHVVGVACNGAPEGEPQCMSDGACPRAQSGVEPGSSYDTGPGACIALHAEQRLIMRAAWRDLLGATLYVTREPCDGCSKMIRGAYISRVVWPAEDTRYEIKTLGGATLRRIGSTLNERKY